MLPEPVKRLLTDHMLNPAGVLRRCLFIHTDFLEIIAQETMPFIHFRRDLHSALRQCNHPLTVYLNIAEFGDGVFGVEAASQRYFNKPASRLSMSEAALLAAVLPNPLRFKANAPSGYVRSRQAWILRQMRQLGGESFMTRNHLY